MPTVSYSQPAREVVVDGKTLTKRTSLKRDVNGNLVEFEEFVEDNNNTITNRVIASPTLVTKIETTVTETDLIVEDLTSQLVDGSGGPYSLTSAAKANTLSVYLNGVMINDEVTFNSNSAFTIKDSYKEAVATDGSLFAIYSKDT
tara:strand:- start:114 stop:548 length:435 start_codon:yes stop_codon:yes gene_type:complete